MNPTNPCPFCIGPVARVMFIGILSLSLGLTVLILLTWFSFASSDPEPEVPESSAILYREDEPEKPFEEDLISTTAARGKDDEVGSRASRHEEQVV